MGICCSVPEEARRGPIRTRFDLDHAPEDAPKSVEHVAVPPDAPTKNPHEVPQKKKFRFPLIGHKDISDRNVSLNAFFPLPSRSNRTKQSDVSEKSHHLTLLSDLFEYLPQVPLDLVGLTYHARHPTRRDTLYFLSYRNNPLTHKHRWTKETYGTTWPTVVRSSAVHTYDPVLKHNVRTIKVRDVLIYDAKDFIQGAVYVVIRDTDGNEHVIIPYHAPTIDGHQYGARLDIQQEMYIDEVDNLLQTMRQRLQKPAIDDITTVREVANEIADEAVENAIETTSEMIENTGGAVGDEIGDGVETDDEDGIAEDDTSPHIQLGHTSDTTRIMEEIMGGTNDE